MNLSFFDRLARSAQVILALVVVLGLSTGLTTSQLMGGERGSGNGDRGENPVVGSLPCLIDDNLDLLFWEGMNEPQPGFQPYGYPVTLGLCSDDLQDDVLDANGQPFGYLNDRWDWRALGLRHQAKIWIDSSAIASGAFTGWLWAPKEYHGGEIEMSSPNGDRKVRIGRHAREMPLVDLVQVANGGVAIANFAIKPPAGTNLPTRHARATVLGPVTLIEFL